jgi:hypothetical protein
MVGAQLIVHDKLALLLLLMLVSSLQLTLLWPSS